MWCGFLIIKLHPTVWCSSRLLVVQCDYFILSAILVNLGAFVWFGKHPSIDWVMPTGKEKALVTHKTEQRRKSFFFGKFWLKVVIDEN